MIGMRLAEEIGLDAADRSALFYALLLKDLGGSSNSASVCALFGSDDRAAKRDFRLANWPRPLAFAPYVLRHMAPEDSMGQRAGRVMAIAMAGNEETRGLVTMRAERGAMLARDLELPDVAVRAIYHLDEHWNGNGYPDGLRKSEIPPLSRILGIAQTAEVFLTRHGPAAAIDMARRRCRSWFDPDLVRAFVSIGADADFWLQVMSEGVHHHVAALEPEYDAVPASETKIDRLCRAFSMVVDAKSPWTACHSQGVSDVAVGIGIAMGLDSATLTSLRRAGLLHDLGKLGVSNTILDKPGPLTERECETLKRHTVCTRSILMRSPCLLPFADLAARHHERLDGSGYAGLDASALTLADRVLCVADIYEALVAKRPHRRDLDEGEAFDVLDQMAGTRICAESVEALRVFVGRGGFRPYQLAA
jgi:HD-GYP domain-containing protein (c-di-GMP phosphodiesterase class II)